jgi:phenylalanyl-tRNA synthetase beta chain
MNTSNTIIEMAVYNPTVVRQNSRQLKASTEASTRLEKFLDPNILPTALKYLTKLIIDNCGGSVGSQVFDHYPDPIVPAEINFDPKLPSVVSGINIPEDFALDIVAKVGSRLDLNLEADLVEGLSGFMATIKFQPTNL